LGVKATLYTLQKDGKRILAPAVNKVVEVIKPKPSPFSGTQNVTQNDASLE
jgi:hypothetical protein